MCVTSAIVLTVALAAPGTVSAKQYTAGTGAVNPVDITVAHGRVVGYELDVTARCVSGKCVGLYDGAGKAYGFETAFRKRLRRDGRFVIRTSNFFRGELLGRALLKGRVSQDTIRGGYSLRSYSSSNVEGWETCWTGKAERTRGLGTSLELGERYAGCARDLSPELKSRGRRRVRCMSPIRLGSWPLPRTISEIVVIL
jgi:hypothetical protein